MILSAGGVFIACQKETNVEVLETQQDQGVEYPIPEYARVELGKLHFVNNVSLGGKGRIVSLGYANSRYYLPADIKHYDDYVRLIEGDAKQLNILKYTVGYYNEELLAFPLVKIELPTEEERKFYIDWLKEASLE